MTSKSKKTSKVAFAAGFVPRTKDELVSAVGQFPWSVSGLKTNREESLKRDARGRRFTSMDQLDNICYYSNVDRNGRPVWDSLPEPDDEGCWLASCVEEGQTFDEYVSLMTIRNGKFRPSSSNVGNPLIYLLPINATRNGVVQDWPTNGPDLRLLAEWVKAFYDRDVVILDAAGLAVTDPATPIPGETKKRKQPRYEGECRMVLRTPTYESYIEGRVSDDGKHHQTHVDGLLSEITAIRTEGIHTYSTDCQIPTMTDAPSAAASSREVVDLTEDEDAPIVRPASTAASSSLSSVSSRKVALHDAFAVIGVTMEDLYSSPGDLFIAGMAAGGSKVAVLSFARYHPRIRMHFQNWYDYGYASKSAEYSYFEEKKARPPTTAHPPESMDAASRTNFLRRAGKLLVHELAHVYCIDHCVHYHCIMNGTGHLVEDFAAPAHLCAVCLRKLQFRMGFDVPQRYKNLLGVYSEGGMTKEAKWVQKRLGAL